MSLKENDRFYEEQLALRLNRRMIAVELLLVLVTLTLLGSVYVLGNAILAQKHTTDYLEESIFPTQSSVEHNPVDTAPVGQLI